MTLITAGAVRLVAGRSGVGVRQARGKSSQLMDLLSVRGY